MCFEDEAGQNLRPPKARSWAPCGHTPVVRVPGKGSGKVSVAGLACYQPGARARLFYRARTHYGRKGERRSMSEAGYASLPPPRTTNCTNRRRPQPSSPW